LPTRDAEKLRRFGITSRKLETMSAPFDST
jgi:hypothetical protein